MLTKSIILAGGLLLCLGCTSPEPSADEPSTPDYTPTLGSLSYTTDRDSTLHYYALGWYEIMDLGDYGGAEVSYRKALSFDPGFLVGQSVLGRLTLDLDERLAIYDRVEAEKDELNGDERLVLDVYQALVRYTNLRDQADSTARPALAAARTLALGNFGSVTQRHPDALYLKAEYLEVVHSVHGPRAALDSTLTRCTPEQRDTPFILGYTAQLRAELGDYAAALADAHRLEAHFAGQSVAKPDAVFADIYFQQGNLAQAKIHADRAHRIDPRNLDASRLKEKIDAGLAGKPTE